MNRRECRKFEKQLAKAFDVEAVSGEEHPGLCGSCHALAEAAQMLESAGGSMRTNDLAADCVEETRRRARLPASSPQHTVPRAAYSGRFAVPVAAAALVLVGVLSFALIRVKSESGRVAEHAAPAAMDAVIPAAVDNPLQIMGDAEVERYISGWRDHRRHSLSGFGHRPGRGPADSIMVRKQRLAARISLLIFELQAELAAADAYSAQVENQDKETDYAYVDRNDGLGGHVGRMVARMDLR